MIPLIPWIPVTAGVTAIPLMSLMVLPRIGLGVTATPLMPLMAPKLGYPKKHLVRLERVQQKEARQYNIIIHNKPQCLSARTELWSTSAWIG